MVMAFGRGFALKRSYIPPDSFLLCPMAQRAGHGSVQKDKVEAMILRGEYDWRKGCWGKATCGCQEAGRLELGAACGFLQSLYRPWSHLPVFCGNSAGTLVPLPWRDTPRILQKVGRHLKKGPDPEAPWRVIMLFVTERHLSRGEVGSLLIGKKLSSLNISQWSSGRLHINSIFHAMGKGPRKPAVQVRALGRPEGEPDVFKELKGQRGLRKRWEQTERGQRTSVTDMGLQGSPA